MTDLEGRSLDEALARAMGWDGEGRNARAFLAVLTRGERKSPPLLTGS